MIWIVTMMKIGLSCKSNLQSDGDTHGERPAGDVGESVPGPCRTARQTAQKVSALSHRLNLIPFTLFSPVKDES